MSIKKRQFHKNETIVASFKHAKETNGRLHLLGLVRSLPISIFLFFFVRLYTDAGIAGPWWESWRIECEAETAIDGLRP